MPARIAVCSNTRAEYLRVFRRFFPGEDLRVFALLEDGTYRRLAAGGRLAQVWLRLLMLAVYPVWLVAAVLCSRKGTVFIVTTNTFFAPLLAGWAGRLRGRRVIHLLYDLYPEAYFVAGGRPGAVSRVMAWITRGTLRTCESTVFLGPRLRVHAETTHGCARRSAIIPVGADEHLFAPVPRPERSAEGAVRVLYSGLLGRMHDTAAIQSLLARSLPAGVALAFRASGAGYSALKQAAESTASAVDWGGPLPTDAWVREMGRSQVALITMKPGAEAVVMPSKTYSALMAGQAVLAICPRDSDLADLVLDQGLGWVVEPGDASGLRAALEEAASGGDRLLSMRQRAWDLGRELFGTEAVGRQWRELLADAGSREGAR